MTKVDDTTLRRRRISLDILSTAFHLIVTIETTRHFTKPNFRERETKTEKTQLLELLKLACKLLQQVASFFISIFMHTSVEHSCNATYLPRNKVEKKIQFIFKLPETQLPEINQLLSTIPSQNKTRETSLFAPVSYKHSLEGSKL